MKNISLITPLRGQHDLFENMMETLRQATSYPQEIEVLIALDSDDFESINKVYFWKQRFDFTWLEFFIVNRSEHFTRDYVNFLARCAQGRFVININADSEFKTKGWDEELFTSMQHGFASKGDDIFLGLVQDGLDRKGEDKFLPNFSCWPVVSKQSIDLLGYFLDERFTIWGPDHFIAMAYKEANRLISLTHIKIDHNSFHSGRRPDDGNYERFKKIHEKSPLVITDEMIRKEANKINRIIKSIHSSEEYY